MYETLKNRFGEKYAKAKLDEIPSSDDDDDEDEEEDDLAEELTEEVEKDFLKTLSCLKRKDPRLYDGKTEFFKASEKTGSKSKTSSERTVRLADLERNVMLEREGHFEDMHDQELADKAQGKSYMQEMEELKRSFKEANNDDGDDDGGGLVKKKSKSAEQVKKEEEDYKSWLVGRKKELSDSKMASDLEGLKKVWSKPNLDKDEEFLRDYILNRRYLGNDDDDNADASFEQVAHDSDENLSEDERNVAKQEEFEVKYNYRFEEPDAEFIKRYPRTVADSMRRETNARKNKRKVVQERKDKERERRREELKQLKALKRKEILGKIEKLKKVAGTRELDFADEDIEGDFDPEEHDRRMAEVFAQYDKVEVEGQDEKPEFSDLGSDFEDELEVENWDGWEGIENGSGNRQDQDDEDGGSEAVASSSTQADIMESLSRKKQRRKSKFAEAVEKKKPVFDPAEKSFEKYLEEYYKLDYEDMIGDLPCRFRYRNVEKNDFGLDANEVLSAPDRELNAWCSLKKMCLYRSEAEERADLVLFKNRGKDVGLKKKLMPSLFASNPEEELQKELDRKSKKARKRKFKDDEAPPLMEEASEDLTEPTKKKKKNKKRKNAGGKEGTSASSQNASQSGQAKKKKIDVNADIRMSDNRLQAYGLNPSQFKRKLKKQKFKNRKDHP